MKAGYSRYLWMDDGELCKFVAKMDSIDLKRDPLDKSEFPLDFVVFYQGKYILNFEYLTDNLQFYFVGLLRKGKKHFFRTARAGRTEKYAKVLLEVEKGIKKLLRS